MKTKTIYRDGNERSKYICVAFLGVILLVVLAQTYPESVQKNPNMGIEFDGGFYTFFIIAVGYMIYYVTVNLSWTYTVTPEHIEVRGKFGKAINEIAVIDIVQTGIVGNQEMVVDYKDEPALPRYIYLSKRVLTEDERKDILRAASDGSVLLFRYSDKLKRALNDICGIYVA